MNGDDIGKLAAQYGLAGVFALIIGWVLYRVGLRLIAAIDRLIEKLDEHTKVDIEHHNQVQQEIISIKSRIDTALQLTPVEGVPIRRSTPRSGVPAGEYALHRPRTRNDGDR